MHITIIPEGEDIENFFPFIRCEGCDKGCKGNYESYHCPICPEDRFKPTRKSKLLQHLQCHFSGDKGYVVSKGFRITTCRLRCGDGNSSPSHFHCPFCGGTFMKRSIFESHLRDCPSPSKKPPLKESPSNDSAFYQPDDISVSQPGDLSVSQPGDISVSQPGDVSVSQPGDVSVSQPGYVSTPKPGHVSVSQPVVSPVSHPGDVDSSMLASFGSEVEDGERKEYSGIIPKHISAIFDGQNIEDVFHIERCRGCDRGCNGNYVSYHCPICPSDKYKATRREKLLHHLNLHFYGDKGFVIANGYRITICRHPCGYVENKDVRFRGHFHCPVCTRTFKSKTSAISHVTGCRSPPIATQAKKSCSNDVLSETSAVESKNAVPSTSAVGSDDDWNLYSECHSTKGTDLHISIIRDGQRVEEIFTLKRCRGCDKDCSGDNSSYHCPICPTERFKPATKIKVMAHLNHHFSGSKDYVVAHGYRITTCHNCCGYKKNSRSHFHCPFCLRTVNGRNFFMAHLEDCSAPKASTKSTEDRTSASDPPPMTPVMATPDNYQLVSQSGQEQATKSPSDDIIPATSSPGKENGEQNNSQACYYPEGYFQHTSIIPDGHSVVDYFSLKRCDGCDAGCRRGLGSYHCPICPPTKFNPTKKRRVMQHLRRHFTEAKCCIATNGFRITICQTNCAIGDGKNAAPHLHCPFCGQTFTNRSYFVAHTHECRGATLPNSSQASNVALSQQSDASPHLGKRTVECKECLQEYNPKYIRQHWKAKHPDIEWNNAYGNSPSPLQQVKSEPSINSDNSSPTPTKATIKQSPVEDFYPSTVPWNQQLPGFAAPEEQLNLSEACQQKGNSALINLISSKLLPLSFVEGPEIRDFVKSLNPNYDVPTSDTARKLLRGRWDLLHRKVEELVMSTENLCLTVDLWSNRQKKSYIGITGHTIVDFRFHSVLLGWQRVRGKYTAENIYHCYEKTLFDYNIGNKIVTIVTDNAPYLLKAFHLPGFENAIAEDFEDCSDDSDSESESNWFVDGTTDIMEYLPEHERCFLHSLQLVVKDALQEATYTTNAFAKVPTMAKFIRKSTEMLEDQPTLQCAASAHWNKQLEMIRIVLSIPEQVVGDVDLQSELTAEERLILQEFVDIMTVFEVAINRVQKQTEITASYVIPVIRNLRHHLTRMSTPNNSILKKACLNSLNNHMRVLEKKALYRRAAVLDPRFKLRWCSEAEAEELKSDLITLLPKPKNAQASDPSCSPPRKRICLFSFMNDKSNTKVGSSEVETYLDEDCLFSSGDALAYWKENAHRMPCLARLAQRYLSVPVSSTPLENIFITAGKIVLPNHVKMADKEFEMMMYSKCNSHLL